MSGKKSKKNQNKEEEIQVSKSKKKNRHNHSIDENQLIEDKPTKKKGKHNKESPIIEVTENETPVKKKKKNRGFTNDDSEIITERKPKKHNIEENGVSEKVYKNKKSKKYEIKQEEIDIKDEHDYEDIVEDEVEEIYHDDADVNIKKEEIIGKKKEEEEITWSNEDLIELVENLKKVIPKNDNMAFMTRSEKLEWQKVAFKDYTVDECKKTWLLLAKKIRKYRLMSEVLVDAKEIIIHPPHKKKKGPLHPDMPKRPLSSYLLFYLKKKGKIVAENPGIDMTDISKKVGIIFKNLPPEKKAKYEKMAAKAKAEYDEKMKIFYEMHPEFKIVKEKPHKQIIPKERIPKKPATPFGCFYQSELTRENVPDAKKISFKELCKERWKQMSDKKKLEWIILAEEQQVVYEEALKNYKLSHPDFVVNHATKLQLTKEEMKIKDRDAGKPNKPPANAYGLFAQRLLQSEDIRQINNKERLNHVSNQWKTMSDEEKQQYKDLHQQMVDKYKLDFAHYLGTLPEDKRKIEILANEPKRKKVDDADGPSKKKRKVSESGTTVKKFNEPQQPPISPYKYFVSVYKGDRPAKAWKKLSNEEKLKYEKELNKKKREYIAAFEKFLKGLSKEDLEIFSNNRLAAEERARKNVSLIEEEERELNSVSDSDDSDSSDDSDDD